MRPYLRGSSRSCPRLRSRNRWPATLPVSGSSSSRRPHLALLTRWTCLPRPVRRPLLPPWAPPQSSLKLLRRLPPAPRDSSPCPRFPRPPPWCLLPRLLLWSSMGSGLLHYLSRWLLLRPIWHSRRGWGGTWRWRPLPRLPLLAFLLSPPRRRLLLGVGAPPPWLPLWRRPLTHRGPRPTPGAAGRRRPR